MESNQAATSLQQEVDAVREWHHTIDLGQGVLTPGKGGDTEAGLKRVAIPDDLSGKSVLDIGAWDGFYSFECERRGAARVLATDLYIWRQAGWDGKAGFELARRALGSRVEDREIDVYDISPETIGIWDLVLFLGVLYHVRDPFGALTHAASVTGELLIVETHVDLLDVDRPAIAFYPGAEVCGDATNWFGPNVPALISMLQTLEFGDIRLIGEDLNPSDADWVRNGPGGSHTQGTRRAVVHARRV